MATGINLTADQESFLIALEERETDAKIIGACNGMPVVETDAGMFALSPKRPPAPHPYPMRVSVIRRDGMRVIA